MASINYDHTLQVEVLSEFMVNVTNKLANYLLKANISLSDDKNPLVVLLNQLDDTSSENLFEKSEEELNQILFYWKQMNVYITRIVADLGATA